MHYLRRQCNPTEKTPVGCINPRPRVRSTESVSYSCVYVAHEKQHSLIQRTLRHNGVVRRWRSTYGVIVGCICTPPMFIRLLRRSVRLQTPLIFAVKVSRTMVTDVAWWNAKAGDAFNGTRSPCISLSIQQVTMRWHVGSNSDSVQRVRLVAINSDAPVDSHGPRISYFFTVVVVSVLFAVQGSPCLFSSRTFHGRVEIPRPRFHRVRLFSAALLTSRAGLPKSQGQTQVQTLTSLILRSANKRSQRRQSRI